MQSRNKTKLMWFLSNGFTDSASEDKLTDHYNNSDEAK